MIGLWEKEKIKNIFFEKLKIDVSRAFFLFFFLCPPLFVFV